MRERVWFQDPSGFITAENYGVIIPTASQTYTQQLNAVVRLSVYYAAAMLLIRRSIDILVLPAVVAGVTFMLYKSYEKRGAEEVEPWRSENCVRPTKSNPFMNALPTDSRTRLEACDPLDPQVKLAIKDEFDKSIFRDMDDVWERNNAGRNFYTTAATTFPNDRGSFAEWLYSSTRVGGKQTRPPRNSVY